MDLGLAGRSVLITGASQGIGEGLAHAFGAEGCDLFLIARNAEKLSRVALDVSSAYGVEARCLPLDLTSTCAIDSIMEFASSVDVLVNNAGAIPGGTLWDIDSAAWRAGWDLKVFGYIDLTRAMYLAMKRRARGVILNNIGNGGENVDFHYIAGSTGNAALMAFTRALGGRSLDDGIRVLGINPGPVDTERIRSVVRERAARMPGEGDHAAEILAGYPLGRPASVSEVADLFVYLASDRAGYTSGTIVTVDGGLASKRSIT